MLDDLTYISLRILSSTDDKILLRLNYFVSNARLRAQPVTAHHKSCVHQSHKTIMLTYK